MFLARVIGFPLAGLLAGALTGCGSGPKDPGTKTSEPEIFQLGDSPVRVSGGSITFHAKKDWTRSSPVGCSTAALDKCIYLTGPLNTQNIALAGFKSGNGSMNQKSAWTIIVYETTSMPNTHGIVLKSTDSSGKLNDPNASGYLTIQGLASNYDGFYAAMIPLDKYFQDLMCPARVGTHCGEMAAAQLNTNIPYSCSYSFGCNIYIGYTP